VRRGVIGVIGLGGLVLLLGGWAWFSGAPPLIEGVTIEGGERISASQVRALSGLRIGQPWVASLRDRATRALLAANEIKRVRIEPEARGRGRVWLRIAIEEREPFGVVELPERGRFWADAEGYLLGPIQKDPELTLPVMTGVIAAPTPQGERIMPEAARRAFRAFFSLPGRELARFARLHFRGYDLELRTREGWTALLPVEGLSRHINRLLRVVEALERSLAGSSVWSRIDLRFEGEVTLAR
jgi:hypothetical protein